MTTDADFTSSSPGRWEIAMARAAVVREFLATYPRTAETADECAARLGMRRSGFYRLVRAFRMNREAPPPERANQGRPRLTADAEAVIADALREAPGMGVAGLETIVRRLSAERGITAPSRTAIRARVPRSFNDDASTASGGRLVFDEVDLGLGVRDRSGMLVTPTLSAFLDVGSGVVAGHWLGVDADIDARADAAASDAEAGGSFMVPPTPASTGRRRRTNRIRTLLDGRPRDRGSALIAALGLRLGAIALRPRFRQCPIRNRNVVEVDLQITREAVRRLVALHNAGRRGVGGPSR